MRFYIKCPCCGGLDLTDITTNNLEGEVDNLRCNKCATVFGKQFVVIVDESNAPSKREEEFVNFLEASEFTWKGQNIEEFDIAHLNNIKKYIERNCSKYDLHPMQFSIYKNILAELDKRIKSKEEATK